MKKELNHQNGIKFRIMKKKLQKLSNFLKMLRRGFLELSKGCPIETKW